MSRQLVKAVENGNLPLVRQLVENGADVHMMHDKPLRKAVINGYLEIVKYLVVRGANIFAKNNDALADASFNVRQALTSNYYMRAGLGIFKSRIFDPMCSIGQVDFEILEYLLGIHIKTGYINGDTFSASMLINNFKYTRMHLKHNIAFANRSYIVDLDIIVSKLMIRNATLPSYIRLSPIFAPTIGYKPQAYDTNTTRKLYKIYGSKSNV